MGLRTLLIAQRDRLAALDKRMGSAASELERAVGERAVEQVRLLCREGADADFRCTLRPDGETLLHIAAGNGDVEICRLLLTAGATTGAKTDWGETPLHSAALAGSAETCSVLLEAGAAVSAKSAIGATPLHLATSSLKTCRVLVKAGANLQSRTTKQFTPLHSAAASGNGDVCRFLTDCGADLDVLCGEGLTPLHHAVRRQQITSIKALVAAGADVHALSSAGETPLAMATTTLACTALVELGADPGHIPDDASPDYLTPFQSAVRAGNLHSVRFFIEHCGEDLSQCTLKGRTLLQLAARTPTTKTHLLGLKTGRAVENAVGMARMGMPVARQSATWLSPL